MGDSKNHHFYDFGISRRVPEPRNQLFLYFETAGYLKKSRNILEHLRYTIFININILGITLFENVGKDGRQTMMKIRLINSW